MEYEFYRTCDSSFFRALRSDWTRGRVSERAKSTGMRPDQVRSDWSTWLRTCVPKPLYFSSASIILLFQQCRYVYFTCSMKVTCENFSTIFAAVKWPRDLYLWPFALRILPPINVSLELFLPNLNLIRSFDLRRPVRNRQTCIDISQLTDLLLGVDGYWFFSTGYRIRISNPSLFITG